MGRSAGSVLRTLRRLALVLSGYRFDLAPAWGRDRWQPPVDPECSLYPVLIPTELADYRKSCPRWGGRVWMKLQCLTPALEQSERAGVSWLVDSAWGWPVWWSEPFWPVAWELPWMLGLSWSEPQEVQPSVALKSPETAHDAHRWKPLPLGIRSRRAEMEPW